MGGHGHAEPYKVPHPSIYKVENVPELRKTQEALARQGLKDPWLRNEAWRFDPKHFGTHANRAGGFFLRGFGWGFAAFVVTIGAEYVFMDNNHGHGHDENHNDKHNEE